MFIVICPCLKIRQKKLFFENFAPLKINRFPIFLRGSLNLFDKSHPLSLKPSGAHIHPESNPTTARPRLFDAEDINQLLQRCALNVAANTNN